MVVAVPLAPFVERDDEDVSAFQPIKDRLPIVLARHRITERRIEAVQNGSPQQELADSAALPLQHFIDQVIHDVAVVAGERCYERRRVVPALHGKSGELKGRYPSLRARLQRGKLLWRESNSHRASEERPGLFCGEPQIGCPNLDKLAASTETRKVKGRISPAGNDYS